MNDREGEEQAMLLEEIEYRFPEVFRHIFHVPNGGHRHKSVAGKLKAQGVRAGVPDLVITIARGGFFGFYIEFKAAQPYSAAVSASQKAYLAGLQSQGYLAIVCRGAADAIEQIRAYMRLPKTVVVK